MINKESPQNLFRLLTCRDIDFHNLKGMLLDHACLLDTYAMNRDAKMLENKKVLVDGLHWNAQKKNKKSNSKGKGGHLGCSESFNWNLYKKHTKETVNSQGREQLHALVEKCATSLRLMSYQHFMIFMKGEHYSIDYHPPYLPTPSQSFRLFNIKSPLKNLLCIYQCYNALPVFFACTNLHNRKNKK